MDDESLFLYRAYDELFAYEPREIAAQQAFVTASNWGEAKWRDFEPVLSPVHPKPPSDEPAAPMSPAEIAAAFGKLGVKP